MMCRSILMILIAAFAAAASAAPQAAPSQKRSPHGAAVGLARHDHRGGKPVAPLRFDLTRGQIFPDGRQVVRVSITPVAEGTRLDVEVEASRGLFVTAGPAQWSGPGKNGRAVSRDLVLRSLYKGERRLIVSATLHQEGAGTQSGVAIYRVGPQDNAPLGEVHPGARLRRRPDGRKIIEIPAESF